MKYVLDDHLVVTAELEGMRRLALLDRPKISVVHEDVAGASCHWNQVPEGSGHWDLVRLRPDSDVPLRETLAAIQASTQRRRGGHLELRGAASSLAGESALLVELGGRMNTELPRELMARGLEFVPDVDSLGDGLSVVVATDAETLAGLRTVVGQAFHGAAVRPAESVDVEADFFHAPGVMTYVALLDAGVVVSTGSILIVDGVANVWSVATLPAARGRGAATAIMQALCGEATKQGAHAAVLRTTPNLAVPDGLYAKVGFVHVGQEYIWMLNDVDDLQL